METIQINGKGIAKWTVGASTFLAWPEAGARLLNWNLTFADGTVRDVIYWPEDADMDNIAKVRGGNPILFPFSGRTFCDAEIFKWKDADGTVRPMPMHGFARDGKFVVENSSERGFIARLEPSEASREAYPYDYEFRVRYRFEELSFTVDLMLTNTGKTPIPWSAGHHFYFQLPWHAGTRRSDYRIVIPAKKAVRQNQQDGTLSAEKLDEETFLMDAPELSDRIHSKLKHNTVVFGPRGGEEDVKIAIGAGPSVPPWTSVVTWTEKSDSPFYCVEPWMGPPNAAEHKNGLHYVDPGKTEVFTVEVSLA